MGIRAARKQLTAFRVITIRTSSALVITLLFVSFQFSGPAAAFHTRPAVIIQDQNPTVTVGTNIIWFITVNNPLDVPLRKVTVSDGSEFPKCSHSFTGPFPARTSEAYVCSFVPTTTGALSNMVTVTYRARNAKQSNSDEVTATVNSATPSVSTTLTPPGPVTGGTQVSDQATLNGASPTAGGSVSYAVFSNNTCTTQVASLGSKTVTNGSVGPSSEWTSVAGNYWFQATYSGDGSNAGPVSSACTSEPLLVNAFTPSLSTTLTPPGPVTDGTSVSDRATLSGATATAGGSVSYAVFANNTCTTLVTSLGTVTVTDGMAGASTAWTATPAGNYWFQATYTGDGSNPGPVSSACDSEPLVVQAGAITLLKTANISSYSAAGTLVTYSYKVTNTDNVTLNPVTVTDPMVGLSAISCPDTSLTAGQSETCTATYTTTATDVTNGSISNTGTATGTPPTGPNVTAASSVTVPVRETPGFTTSPTSGSIDLGQSDADTGVVTGTGGVTPTGSVTFYVCGPTAATACTTNGTNLGNVVVSGSGSTASAKSPAYTPTGTGTYCFLGVYSGDSKYAGASDSSGSRECFTVGGAPPSEITTAPTRASITLGQSDADTGYVNGTGGVTPTGNVTFYVCGPFTTATACTTNGTKLGSVVVSGSGSTASATSPTYTPTATGTYCFLGVYSGDSNYAGASDSDVPRECFTVAPAPPGLTTTPSGAVSLGGTETDAATVTGTGTTAPSGSVTFYVTSSTGVVDLGSVGLGTTGSDTASGTSLPYTPSAIGTYCFLALYSGDSNYMAASDGAIPEECFSVTRHHAGG
jgi:hypothetical protein